MDADAEEKLVNKRLRHSDEETSLGSSILPIGGWKRYPEFPCGTLRAFPGNPDRERYKVYLFPYAILSVAQREAAHALLGVADEDSWEKKTPRRLHGVSSQIVLEFQSRTWKYLSKEEQQNATKLLDLTEDLWNNALSVFHDDHWFLPGITLTTVQFKALLSTLDRMAERRVLCTKEELVKFLLQTEKVFIPSQALAMVRELQSHPCWNAMKAENTRGDPHAVIASFLTKTRKLANLETYSLLSMWDDESSGCVWGNFCADERNKHNRIPDGLPTYAAALQDRQDRTKALRHETAAVLSGYYPTSTLPALDRSLILYILNTWVGTAPSVDPQQCSWPTCYQHVPVVDTRPTSDSSTR